MKTGNGKIANLPAHIRDELNFRLNDGEQTSELVDWLNAKPEVIEALKRRFDGRPISEQNLSQWRTHGYRQWHAYHIILDENHALSDNVEAIAETGIDCDKLILTLTASYAEMTQRWIITPTDEMLYKLRVYKELTNGVLALQRAELQKIRLEIARERLELLREKRGNKSPASSPPSTETATSPGSSHGSPPSDSESRPTDPTPEKSAQSDPPTAPPVPPSPTETPAPQQSDSRGAGSLSQPASQPDQPTAPIASPAAAPVSEESESRHSVILVSSLAPSQSPSAPPKPAAPPVVPFWPSRRPGAPPRNASPRNPLGLL